MRVRERVVKKIARSQFYFYFKIRSRQIRQGMDKNGIKNFYLKFIFLISES